MKVKYISEIRLSSDRHHIERVKVISTIEFSKKEEDVHKTTVVNEIKAGKAEFYTAPPSHKKGEKRRLGDRVIIYSYNGKDYLKTVGNTSTKDNLGQLPEY